MSNRHIDCIECKQLIAAIYIGETNPEFNPVIKVHWHVSVLYNDPYHLAGTFMEDGISNNSPNITLLDPLYLNLFIDLTNNTPSLHFTISRESDGSLALSNHERSKLNISVKIEPSYQYWQHYNSSPEVMFALCRHYNISDPLNYLSHLFERVDGPMHICPEPSLPPHWEHHISDGGISYFYNKKTSARRWSPGEAFTCLSFFSSSCKENVIHDIFMLDEHRRAAIKTRHQRNTLQLLRPMFQKHQKLTKLSRHQLEKFNCQQLKKFNCRKLRKFSLLCHVTATSLQKDNGNDLIRITVQVAAERVDVEHIVFKSFCLLMSFFFVAMIVIGRD
jgi:hypothetical protein